MFSFQVVLITFLLSQIKNKQRAKSKKAEKTLTESKSVKSKGFIIAIICKEAPRPQESHRHT